ncbi:MAG: putative two-component system response regulator [Planctomycetota bacterium]|jgi:putative two-component system response regulator
MESGSAFRILITDDDVASRKVLQGFLQGRGFDVSVAESAREASDLLAKKEQELLISATSMSEFSGLDLLARAQAVNPALEVILMTGYLDVSFAIQGMRKGAVDFFHKPFNFEKIGFAIDRVQEQRDVRQDAQRYLIEKRESQLQQETALSLARAAEGRDRLNIGHGRRVAAYAVKLAKKLCYSKSSLARLELGCKLHDIGKIGIDDAVLNKPGKLTEAEFLAMKRHSEIGEYIIKPVSFFSELGPILRWHHERWDGRGYPDGLAGEEIPLDARIACLCDFFDAVTSVRPYRSPMALPDALALIMAERGKHFDPMLVDLFLEIQAPYLESVA